MEINDNLGIVIHLAPSRTTFTQDEPMMVVVAHRVSHDLVPFFISDEEGAESEVIAHFFLWKNYIAIPLFSFSRIVRRLESQVVWMCGLRNVSS